MEQKISELTRMVRDGVHPVVTFCEAIGDLEGYLEEGMRGRIVAAKAGRDRLIALEVALDEFEAFNRPLESANYFNEDGRACLTAHQAGCYTGRESIWVDADGSFGHLFAVEPDDRIAIYQEYRAQGAELGYVQWLESAVVELRGALRPDVRARLAP